MVFGFPLGNSELLLYFMFVHPSKIVPPPCTPLRQIQLVVTPLVVTLSSREDKLSQFLPNIIIIITIILINIEFFTSQLWLENIHLSWDVVINRIRLGSLICS